jgi:hypothetical protein
VNRRRLIACLGALALVAAGCNASRSSAESASSSADDSPSASSPSLAVVPPIPGGLMSGRGSAYAEMARLCTVPPQPPTHLAKTKGRTPAQIARIEREVSTVSHLKYTRPVPVKLVTPQRMSTSVERQTRAQLPFDQLSRRSLAWQTIGVIPVGTSLARQELRFLGQQVLGHYDPSSGALVVSSSGAMGGEEKLTLAHELTHAIDDQNFGLARLQLPAQRCLDDSAAAALSVAEGSAMYFSFQVALRYFSLADRMSLLGSALQAPAPKGIVPFVVAQEEFPYTAGMQYVTDLVQQGGTALVDGAIQNPPTSTAQIMEPQRWVSGGARPEKVQIPDLSSRLGPGWSNLDVQQVGQEWLSQMLALRLPQSTATGVTSPWRGGTYRAWSDGSKVAVTMATTWSSPAAAQAFAGVLQGWVRAGGTDGPTAAVYATGDEVVGLFASDPATLALLQGA